MTTTTAGRKEDASHVSTPENHLRAICWSPYRRITLDSPGDSQRCAAVTKAMHNDPRLCTNTASGRKRNETTGEAKTGEERIGLADVH